MRLLYPFAVILSKYFLLPYDSMPAPDQREADAANSFGPCFSS